MIKTKCFADVSSTMNARDMEAIKRGVKERVDAGTVKLATIRTAEIGSVQDLLADIEGERAELMKLAREQHADVFVAPAAEVAPKAESATKPSAEAKPSETSSTPNNVGVSEPPASEYSAAKPYENDLSGSPVPSPAARALGDRPGQPSAKAGDVATAASVSAPEGRYATRAALVTTREQKLGYAGQVTDLAGAANALAYLNKSAVERLDGLVTDAKGTPLAIIGGFKGALSQAAVYPATILGEAMQVPGAANLWLVHNHPSGSSTLSRADSALAENIAGVFDGTGVRVRGVIAVTPKEWSGSLDWDFSDTTSGSISPATGPTVPAQERQIVEDGKLGPAIESPRAAKDLVASLVQQNMGRPTIVLLDAQHNPVAAIPWAPEDALPMKGNGKLDALFRAIAQSNAGTALIGTGGTLATGAPVMSDAQAQNLGAALHKADVRVLDIIDRDGGSASEQGKRLKADVLFSRQGEDQTKTAAFLKWFGDWQHPKAYSSMRPKDMLPVSYAMAGGKPQVLYHTTIKDFAEFEPGRPAINSTTFGDNEVTRSGMFFAEKPGDSDAYGGKEIGGRTMPVYLRELSPLDLTSKMHDLTAEAEYLAATGLISERLALASLRAGWESFDGANGKAFAAAVQAAGYDSVVFHDVNPDTGDQFVAHVVFSPEQIKSAIGNHGAFGPTNPDIRFSRDAAANTDDNATPSTDPQAQAKAQSLNDALVGYGLGKDWSNSHEAVELPDNVSGIGKEFQAAFGRDIQLVAPTADRFDVFRGIFIPSQPKTVYVNVNAKASFVQIALHELWHGLEQSRPDLAAWYREQARPYYKNVDEYQAKLNKLIQPGEKPYGVEAALRELDADFLGDSMVDMKFLQQLADASPSKFRGLMNTIRLWLVSLAAKMRGLKSEKYISDVEALRVHLKDVMVAFAEGKPLTSLSEPAPKSEPLFSRSQSIIDTIRNAGGGEKIVGQSANTRPYTERQLRGMRNTGMAVQAPTLEERAKTLWSGIGNKLAQGLFDQFAPVKELSKSAYSLLRLSKGASGAFEALLHGGKLKLDEGVYAFDETKRGGVLDTLFKPLGGEHHDFLRWVSANRAERLTAEDREHLFTGTDIEDLKTLSDGDAPFTYVIQHGLRAGQETNNRALIYGDALKTFNAFNKNVLDMAEQSGLIDGESRKFWEHEFYVPFYRVADEDSSGVRGMNIKGSVVRQKAFEKLKGGSQKLNADLLDNTLMNWAHLLDASAKNRAAKATLEAAESMGKAIPASSSTASELANAMGKKGNVVWFMDEGVKRHYIVEDKPLLEAISSLEYAGMRGPVMDAMGAFKRTLTIGVTASPFFKVRNLIRDSVQVIASGPISYNPVANIAQGWKLTDPKSDAYFNLLAGGGTIHFGTMLEGSEGKRIQKLVDSGVNRATILDSSNKIGAFYSQYLKPAFNAYNELGNRGEAINRAALYAQLRGQGIGHAEASLQARDLMDFSMQGTFTTIRFLSQVVPFFNARIQGLYKLGRAAKEDPARMSAVIGATAAASLALLMAFSDDDDWKKREEWDRNNFWWFKFGGMAFRIPKPFEVGAIATLAERGFELAFDKEMTGKRFRDQVLTLLGDNLSLNPIPQMVKPMLEVYANKNSFTGRPIENMGMERLRAEYRYTANTSMAARGLSGALNSVAGVVGSEALSPVQVDHMLRGYFGWLGTFVVGAGDILARPLTGQPERPSASMWNSFSGGMISDLRDAPSRYISQMYKQSAEVERAYATWRDLLKQGKGTEAAEFQAENRDEIVKHSLMTRVKRSEGLLNQQIRAIERGSLPGDEKRERIRDLMARKNTVANTAMQAN